MIRRSKKNDSPPNTDDNPPSSDNTKPKRKLGRPSKYDETIPERVYQMALLGLTDVQMAHALGVSVESIDSWKRVHPAFLQALKDGKGGADAKVAEALYKRAIGFTLHENVEVRVVDKEVELVNVPKYYPPDTKAALAWLFNRQKEYWRDARRVEMTGKDGEPIRIDKRVDLSDLDDDELTYLENIGVKLDGTLEDDSETVH